MITLQTDLLTVEIIAYDQSNDIARQIGMRADQTRNTIAGIHNARFELMFGPTATASAPSTASTAGFALIISLHASNVIALRWGLMDVTFTAGHLKKADGKERYRNDILFRNSKNSKE